MTCSGAASPAPPSCRKPAVGEVHPGVDHPGGLQQGAFDPRDAAPAGDAFDGKLHFDRAVGARTREQ